MNLHRKSSIYCKVTSYSITHDWSQTKFVQMYFFITPVILCIFLMHIPGDIMHDTLD